MDKEFFKTETCGNFEIKYFATPNLDAEDCQFGFDVFFGGKKFCSNCECEDSQCCALFDSEEDVYAEAKYCIENCLSIQEDYLEYNPEDNVEEYPEDFQMKDVPHDF